MMSRSSCPKGYRQTEVGVIPEDWAVRRVDTVCKLINGRGFKPFEWQKEGHPIIRIQNLNGSDDFNFYTGAYDAKLEVEPGQLLFAWSGSRGTSFGPHVWRGPLGLLNYHTWKVQVHESEVTRGFFLYALRHLTAFIESEAHGASALVHTQKWEMEGFQFPLPPTKTEQEAIAEALSDADALIESLEQLITKKRQIKQGAMQELLTGKTRLPGFSGEWVVKRLGDESDLITKGTTPTSLGRNFIKQGINFVKIESLTEDGTVLPEMLAAVDEETHRLLKRSQLQENDILFSIAGALGRTAIVNADLLPANTNQALAIIRLKPQSYLRHGFILKYLAGPQILTHVTAINVQAAQANLSLEDIRSFEVPAPSDAEQTAIATILSDMDTAIEALEAKLTKTRQLKQGMMHNLLTGRIRLV